jgi:HAD superfamily hydrolase (TIGR01549 family)
MKEVKIVSGEIDLSRVKGLLFDVDGTLSDTDDRWVDRLTRFLKPIGWLFVDHDPHRFARWAVMSIETPANFLYSLTDRLGIDKPLFKLMNNLLRNRRARKKTHDRFWIIAGVKELLGRLEGHFPMAVVSARDEETTLFFLELFDLTQYFDVIVTGYTCEHTKPFPEPVIFAAKALGLDPEHCLMIGDTIVDVRAGKLAGTQTAAVLCGFGLQKELELAGADIILGNTVDLEYLLLG